jgi:hypothetical protein
MGETVAISLYALGPLSEVPPLAHLSKIVGFPLPLYPQIASWNLIEFPLTDSRQGSLQPI